jgi:hypothetical protein
MNAPVIKSVLRRKPNSTDGVFHATALDWSGTPVADGSTSLLNGATLPGTAADSLGDAGALPTDLALSIFSVTVGAPMIDSFSLKWCIAPI